MSQIIETTCCGTSVTSFMVVDPQQTARHRCNGCARVVSLECAGQNPISKVWYEIYSPLPTEQQTI